MTGKSLGVTIYHNPACGTSRNVLDFIRKAGIEPAIIEYLKTPPDRPTLQSLMARMGIGPRGLLREKGILINRPIVVTPWGVKLCRPSEAVLELLAQRPAAAS